MNEQLRKYFDQQLDRVLAEMPPLIHQLMEQVPLHVEDRPPSRVLHAMHVSDPEALCGLYTGVPLTHKSTSLPFQLPDVVTIYRAGILRLATGADGQIHESELLRQIRITLLHEIGHHHGLDEDDLAELGYG